MEPHLDALYRFSRRLALGRSEAEDLAQDALLRAFEVRDRLKDRRLARAFLLGTARQVHLDRAAHRPALVVLPGAGGAGGDLLLTLRELPERDASALWLREVEGLSDDELATTLGRSPGPDVQGHAPELGPELRALPLALEVAPPAVLATLRGLAAGAAHARMRPPAGTVLVLGFALFAAAVAIGITRAPAVEGLPTALARDVVSQHLRGLAVDAGCEVRAASPAELGEHLSRVLHTEVHVPVPAEGTELVCGRTGFLNSQPTALVLYRRGPATITLFLPGRLSAAAAQAEGSIGTCTAGNENQTLCVLALADAPGILVGELPGPALWSTIGR